MGRPCLEGSKSRNRLSELLAWPVLAFPGRCTPRPSLEGSCRPSGQSTSQSRRTNTIAVRWPLLVALAVIIGQVRCRPTAGEPGVWTKRNSSEINLTAVAWSGRQFLAVGCCSVLTSPDGRKWTRVAQEVGYGEPVTAGSMPYQWQFESVVWGGSQ